MHFSISTIMLQIDWITVYSK